MEGPRAERATNEIRAAKDVAIDEYLEKKGILALNADYTLKMSYHTALTFLSQLDFVNLGELTREDKKVQEEGLKGIAMTPELRQYNLKLRELEARMIVLDKRLESTTREAVENIKKAKQEIQDEFNKVLAEKIEHVKKSFPSNPVYAMANPRLLKENTTLSIAGKEERVETLIKEGVEWKKSGPATCFGQGYEAGAWGGKEMGEKGYYFSKGAGVYQSQEYPCVIRYRLDKGMKGVSLLSVTELEKLGFSQQDIEKGYRQLQKESAFIQNDGLPPKILRWSS